MADLEGIKRFQEEAREFNKNLDFIVNRWEMLSDDQRRDVLRHVREVRKVNEMRNTDVSSVISVASMFIFLTIVGVFFM